MTDNSIAPGPDSGNRKGAGAPKGNRNALRHGLRSAAEVQRRRSFRAYVRGIRAVEEAARGLRGAPPDYLARFDALGLLVQHADIALNAVVESLRIAKPLTIHQDCPQTEAQSAVRRERSDEVHLVQPDALALPAGGLPREAPLGLG
ncbi:MAG: hypothetical protein JO261_05480 [Alphaproteobacteria bacterium]|nr:hypothetical protein [Alphaproteobacteria bacterium]MBV9693133.1 hypothetical protein [Alphaproteobacteria bacterium]